MSTVLEVLNAIRWSLLMGAVALAFFIVDWAVRDWWRNRKT
jgi:hypothetical protein